jgi:antirestriction protein ArdC
MKEPDKSEIKDVYQRITDRIVAELEQGVRPWFKPWNGGNMAGKVSLPLRSTGEAYRGINVLALWMTATAAGYTCAYWFTFRQAQAFGACVRKGEKGTLVVYANRITKTETDPEGEEIEREIPFLKGYTVFNGDQIEGLPERFKLAPPSPEITPAQRIETAEAFFAATGATVQHGGNRAYFAPGLDVIQLPPFESFRDAESYAATKAHEYVHWTGGEKRLDRKLTGTFGSEDYAFEELIAELGSAFLCADLAITPDVRPDHAAYVASWLDKLKNDKRLIFKAAAHAQRAADHLHGYQPQPAGESAPETAAEPARQDGRVAIIADAADKQAAYAARRQAHSEAWFGSEDEGQPHRPEMTANTKTAAELVS